MAVLTRLLLALALVVIAVDMAAATSKTAATFNLALTDYGTGIVGIPEREAATIQELIQLDADVICLQEIPRGTNVQNIVNALAAAGYSSSLSYLHNTTTWTLPDQAGADLPPCPSSLVTLAKKIAKKCPIQTGEPFTAALPCIVQYFWDQVLGLGPECRVCLGTGGSVQQAAGLCLQTSLNINVPGLVMLSKASMTNQEVVDLHDAATLFPRYYLKTDVAGIGTTFCTHLSSDSTFYPELELNFTSYEEQNNFEVRVLLNQTMLYSKVLFLGDLNTGPSIPDLNVDAQFPDSYELLIGNQTGLEINLSPNCTFCADNAWNVVANDNETIVIDHVFTKDMSITCMERVLDNATAVYIEALSGYYPLSDHNGVKACIQV